MTDVKSSTASGTGNFNGQCGECSSDGSYYSASGSMQLNQSATVNGSSPQNCVIGNDNAQVQQIDLQNIAGPYSYQVRVYAQGPDSIFGGSFYLAFQDATGDVYYLSIYSSSISWHEVSYNSKDPTIVAVYWSDYSFRVDSDAVKTTKAKFKVVSPADPVS